MSAPRRVYLDNNATTPVRPEVLDAMLPYLKSSYGNPNSVHRLGQEARKAVEEARASVARLIGAASPDEIVFTSCGSEGNAMAIQGAAWRGSQRRILSSAVEHESVRGTLDLLSSRGFLIERLGVDADGVVDPGAAAAALGPDACLVSVMHANNEVGAVQPVRELAASCRERGVLFHMDAVQSAGKIPLDARAIGADLVTISGHKINAPKGVGALYIRSGLRMPALIAGHQEKNRRGGTENVAGIVGLGAAAELARRELDGHAEELVRLRGLLEEEVLRVPGAHSTSRARERLPGTSHFCFAGVEGHHLVVALDLEGICVSAGPACSGGLAGGSHVLAAMGVDPSLAAGGLRVSLGWGNTEEDVRRFLAVLPGAVEKLRTVGIK